VSLEPVPSTVFGSRIVNGTCQSNSGRIGPRGKPVAARVVASYDAVERRLWFCMPIAHAGDPRGGGFDPERSFDRQRVVVGSAYLSADGSRLERGKWAEGGQNLSQRGESFTAYRVSSP